MEKKSFFNIILSLIIGLGPFIGTIIIVPFVIRQASENVSFSAEMQFLFLVGASLIIGIGFFPSTLTAIICGYFYGWVGLLYVIIVYVTASVIGFSLAKSNRKFFMKLLESRKKVKKSLEAFFDKSFQLIILLRISPVLPFAWCNYFLGINNVSFKVYITATIIGMIPRTVLSVWVGVSLTDIINITAVNDQFIYKIGAVILLFFSSFGIGILGKRALKKVKNAKVD